MSKCLKNKKVEVSVNDLIIEWLCSVHSTSFCPQGTEWKETVPKENWTTWATTHYSKPIWTVKNLALVKFIHFLSLINCRASCLHLSAITIWISRSLICSMQYIEHIWHVPILISDTWNLNWNLTFYSIWLES